MYYGWVISFSLILLQVLFGAMIIFTELNLWIALFHAFFITCYFGMLSYFMLLSNRSAHQEQKVNVKQTNKNILHMKQNEKNEVYDFPSLIFLYSLILTMDIFVLEMNER